MNVIQPINIGDKIAVLGYPSNGGFESLGRILKSSFVLNN